MNILYLKGIYSGIFIFSNEIQTIMERRKVIRQGKGTLTMSLPMEWIRQAGIKPGGELFVEQKGLQLVVSPTIGQRPAKESQIDLGELSRPLAFVMIYNLYIRGDEEIRIKFDDPETLDSVTDAARSLIGFEIVEQSGGSCTLKELARGESEDFDTLLRRVMLLLLSIAEEGQDALKRGDKALLISLAKRDKTINSLVSYCLRVLNKRGKGDIQKAMHLYTLLNLLEQLGDCYSRFYQDVGKTGPKALAITKETAGLLRGFYELFYDFDYTSADKLWERRNRIRRDIEAGLRTMKCRDDLAAMHYLRSIADLIVDIEKFQIAMQMR